MRGSLPFSGGYIDVFYQSAVCHDAVSFFILSNDSCILSGLFVSIRSAFSTFSDESLGLLAIHLM